MLNAQVPNNLGKRSLLCEQYSGIRATDDNGRGDKTTLTMIMIMHVVNMMMIAKESQKGTNREYKRRSLYARTIRWL